MKIVPPVQLWSAAPTPLTADLTVDVASVGTMVRAALEEGVTGLFLAGTCGEGPWLPDRERSRLVAAAVAESRGRIRIAVQVTDNSVPRILENMRQAESDGADCVVIAPPPLFMNTTPQRVVDLFIDAADASPLPVGIYDLGTHRSVAIPEARLAEVYLRPNVHFVKDSSASPSRRQAALDARRRKPRLELFNGDEFRCMEYLEAGYDGCMFGGMAAVAPQVARIVELFRAGRIEEARAGDAALQSLLYGIYGGRDISCWLTGLKHFLVRRGIFASSASYLGYPLSEECRRFIDEYVATGAPAGR